MSLCSSVHSISHPLCLVAISNCKEREDQCQKISMFSRHYCPTCLCSIIILYHVLDDQVAVEFMRVVILIASTAMLVCPLNVQEGLLSWVTTTLEVFLKGGGCNSSLRVSITMV